MLSPRKQEGWAQIPEESTTYVILYSFFFVLLAVRKPQPLGAFLLPLWSQKQSEFLHQATLCKCNIRKI